MWLCLSPDSCHDPQQRKLWTSVRIEKWTFCIRTYQQQLSICRYLRSKPHRRDCTKWERIGEGRSFDSSGRKTEGVEYVNFSLPRVIYIVFVLTSVSLAQSLQQVFSQGFLFLHVNVVLEGTDQNTQEFVNAAWCLADHDWCLKIPR